MKFKLVEDFESNRKVTLEVKFEVYGRYGDGGEIITAKVSGKDLRHALMRMVDRMRLYINSNDIEEKNLTAEQVLDSIAESNGDGCDMIYLLKNLTSGEVLIDCSDCYAEQDWDDEEFDESFKEALDMSLEELQNTADRYLDVEIDELMRTILDKTSNMTREQLSRLVRLCRNFYALLEDFASNTLAESLTESSVSTPVVPAPYNKYLEIVPEEELDIDWHAKECSSDIAREIAQGAKRALKLPAHEVEMLEHDINNLRSNEWVEQFFKLSAKSAVRELFFKYAVERDEYGAGDRVSGATILGTLGPKEGYEDIFDSWYFLIDDPDFPVVEIVHDRLYPVELDSYSRLSENFSKEFESRELLDTGELTSALKALIKEYGHMELTTPVYLETADNSNGRTLKIGYELGEKLSESKQDDYSHNLEVVKDYIKEHPECKNDLFDTINDLSERGVITIPATCCEDPENVTEAEAETYINNLIKQLNLNEDIFQDLNNRISEIDENARKYIYDRLTDFYMPDEPEADRKKVTEKIFKKLKYMYREMFDFIPYWGGGEDAADNMWDEGVDERITELIGYENFPEEVINDVVIDCGYIIPDND